MFVIISQWGHNEVKCVIIKIQNVNAADDYEQTLNCNCLINLTSTYTRIPNIILYSTFDLNYILCHQLTFTFKRGGVCIYYKESLPVRVINLSYFEKALVLDMTYRSKKVIVSVIYRSTSQIIDEFNSFLSNLEKLVSDINNRKPALQVTLMQDLSHGGLMILILQRDQKYLHYPPQMVFLS